MVLAKSPLENLPPMIATLPVLAPAVMRVAVWPARPVPMLVEVSRIQLFVAGS